MDEYLFRGKRIDNGEWAEGSLLYDEENCEAYIAEYFENKSAYVRDVNPKTVGQYTGLQDKNGKKIFKGDIINEPKAKIFGAVKYGIYKHIDAPNYYQNGDCGFYFYCPANKNLRPDLNYWAQYVVCGNVYDNPELLEVQHENKLCIK